jgi:hypothetical protein
MLTSQLSASSPPLRGLAYLDGHEDRAQRLHGTEQSLDRLGSDLSRQ